MLRLPAAWLNWAAVKLRKGFPRRNSLASSTSMGYYGTDLLDYIDQEFRNPRPERAEAWQPHATVSFWRDYL